MIVEAAAIAATIALVALFGVRVAKWVEARERELDAETEAAAPPVDHLPALVEVGLVSTEEADRLASASATEAAYRADEPTPLFGVAQRQLEQKRSTMPVADVRMLDTVEKATRPPDPDATVVEFRKVRRGLYPSDGDYVLSDGRIVRQEFLKMYWRATGEKLSQEDLPIEKRIQADWDRQAKARRLAEWKEKES